MLARVATALFLLAATACNPKTDAPALPELRVRYPIPALRATMAPFVAAEATGAYAAEKLYVKFGYGGSGTNPVSMVLQGQDDVAILGGPDTLLVANGKGADLVAIAVLHRNADFVCLVTRADSGIERVEQLQGKRVGLFPGHISTDVLHAFLRRSSVAVTEVDVGYDYGQLVAKNVDAQWAFTTAAAVELPEKGVPVNIISPTRAGIRTHGYTIFTRRDFLKNQRAALKSFLAATFKGLRYAHEHPAETASMLVEQDTTGNLEQQQVMRRLAQLDGVTSLSNPYPPGYMDREMFEDTYARLNDLGLIEQPYDVGRAYDTSLLQELHGPAMQMAEARVR
jgi:ABC-type nitrate/sulfonate/bicarbonate transport system substrate-binding protein